MAARDKRGVVRVEALAHREWVADERVVVRRVGEPMRVYLVVVRHCSRAVDGVRHVRAANVRHGVWKVDGVGGESRESSMEWGQRKCPRAAGSAVAPLLGSSVTPSLGGGPTPGLVGDPITRR